MSEMTLPLAPDDTDRALIRATQAGLPLSERPYHALADSLGLDPQDVMARMTRMQESGIIRRIAAVPNHYALGYTGNGMTVWDVDDDDAQKLGREIGDLDFVSHCYLRPRHLPDWPYNLFAMVHGLDREEVKARSQIIADLLEPHLHNHDILFSTRILKKTGLRIGAA